MNIYSLVYLLAAGTFLYISFYSLAYQGRSKTYRLYAILNIFMVLWTLVDLHIIIAPSPEFFLRVKHLDFFYFPVVFIFYHFSLVVAKKSFMDNLSFRIPYYGTSVFAAAVIFFFLQPEKAAYQDGIYFSVWNPSQLNFYRVIFLVPSVLALMGVWNIWRHLVLVTFRKKIGMQMVVVLAMIFPVALGIITHYILDVIVGINITFSLTAYFALPNLILAYILGANKNKAFNTEGMLNGILQRTRDLFIITNPGKKILFVNSQFKKRTGLSELDVRDMNIEDFLSRYTHGCQTTNQSEDEVLEMECTMDLPGSGKICVQISISVATGPDGNITGYIYLIKDINGRKQMATMVKRLSVAVEQSENTVVITDAQGNIEYANPAFERITGYKIADVAGKNPRFLKSGKHDPEFYRNLWETIASGKTWNGDFLNRKKNGILYWERATITPVRDENGTIVNYIAVKDDITKEKHLQEFQNDMEKMMRHDIKSPLNGIINFPDIALQDPGISEDTREILGLIKEAGKQILNQVDLYMNMAKIEEKRFVYSPSPQDILRVLRSVMGDLSSLGRQRKLGVELVFNDHPATGEDKCIIPIDKTIFYAMVANLVKNAMEASLPGQKVTISLECRETGDAIFKVHNETIIPPEIRKRFFEKYSTMGKKAGTGLGTYSARLMAEAMKGKISFTSAEGEGTTLMVQLPLNMD